MHGCSSQSMALVYRTQVSHDLGTMHMVQIPGHTEKLGRQKNKRVSLTKYLVCVLGLAFHKVVYGCSYCHFLYK